MFPRGEKKSKELTVSAEQIFAQSLRSSGTKGNVCLPQFCWNLKGKRDLKNDNCRNFPQRGQCLREGKKIFCDSS